MCGIAGVIANSEERVREFLSASERAQLHRGPDSQGSVVFSANTNFLGLNHQRLSILDLSKDGNQPMYNAKKDGCIAYNGEVYNYKEIASSLDSFKAKTQTDTEIILEAIGKWGITAALSMFNGMWAFAYYDLENKKLYLARDRMGIKPLYYFYDESTNNLYFSSEVKAITSSVKKKFTLNYQAIGEYLSQSLQDTNNNSFFKEIIAVPAGSYIEVDLSDGKFNLNVKSYWELDEACERGSNISESEIRSLFLDSVRLRMRSDVPVGVTLSGGIDSSLIASAMKEELGPDSSQKLNILSVVSPSSLQDESYFIDKMASYLNTDVHKVELDWEKYDKLELIKKVTWHNDSPLGSFSNVAHYLMMEKANELGIKVILSGQGADEILCGYKKYLAFYFQFLIRERHYIKAARVLLSFLRNKSIINQFNFLESKRYLPSFFRKKERSLLGTALLENYKAVDLSLKADQSVNKRQVEDIKKFSVPFLTHYEDRMSMAFSREIRLPFLDYRLVEVFVSMEISKKIRDGWTKYILRRTFQSMLPSAIAWRKDKQGFVSPQERWLKEELRSTVLDTFSESALIFKLKLVNRNELLNAYESFCSQKAEKGTVWYRDVFAPFALELWLQMNEESIKVV
ncbi:MULTISPECIES: asparagine synthase (glutamine-hydrolyzing) [Gammaproteobacteria]|uniref:asparagine synthase (glutamine-hydrolyzing) n=1 Tax=Gammaproteobacteria TaxID=1236 RepID=UPI000DCFB2BC|nr:MULTISPECIES: asparagine synthase (glutamine-hydrolyzing) [Gammaproteobacteria]RTE86060.1 asparagine synthase (glutamine-hydrolyzing) [Aliidiomarina sp. B3213]TCZ91414.1 asparagine synthase (glutamine-hydrolyzing) [Lysobacter sp. N42]